MRSRLSLTVAVTLLASAGVATLGTPAALAAAPAARWQATVGGGWFAWGAPVIGDVTGDGINDVVFGSWDHFIYVLDGHCNTIASIDNRDSVQSAPALYDVDRSGAMDIFIGGDATENTGVPGDSFNGGVFR